MTIHATALAVYGRENQIRKTLEELAELSLELHRALDGRGDNEKITEEMADVEIMLDQMKLLYGSTDAWKEKKLARLATRLGMKAKTRYDWSKAPQWAQWAAMESDGIGYWYEETPVIRYGYAFDINKDEDNCMIMEKNAILDTSGDWRDSLERRPK